VHLTLGILRKSQAVSYALSFFWLDGFAVPTPAQVTLTVGQLHTFPQTRTTYYRHISNQGLESSALPSLRPVQTSDPLAREPRTASAQGEPQRASGNSPALDPSLLVDSKKRCAWGKVILEKCVKTKL